MTPPSLVSVEIGGTSYPWVTEPRCLCCSSPRREDIEREIAKGRAYKVVIRELGLEGELSERNMREHLTNGHMPVHAPAVREVARQQGESVREVLEPLVDCVAAHLTFAHAVLDRVSARMKAGEAEPSVRDGMAAARLIAEVEATVGPQDAAQWEDAYSAVLEDLTEILTPEQSVELGERLDRRLAEQTRSR